MCEQTVLRYCKSLRVTFSDSIVVAVIKKSGKDDAVQI